jgi:hypothetical protein
MVLLLMGQRTRMMSAVMGVVLRLVVLRQVWMKVGRPEQQPVQAGCQARHPMRSG